MVVQIDVADVSGDVVGIQNLPGEGDVGAVPAGHLKVVNALLGSCTWHRVSLYIIYKSSVNYYD